jgi:hypothetical protein
MSVDTLIALAAAMVAGIAAVVAVFQALSAGRQAAYAHKQATASEDQVRLSKEQLDHAQALARSQERTSAFHAVTQLERSARRTHASIKDVIVLYRSGAGTALEVHTASRAADHAQDDYLDAINHLEFFPGARAALGATVEEISRLIGETSTRMTEFLSTHPQNREAAFGSLEKSWTELSFRLADLDEAVKAWLKSEVSSVQAA